jgi:glycosyltransferase involved in cell wall biosynthesis
MIINRTDEVNRKRKSNISYYRLVNDHKSVELADFIVQIGTNYTIQTYPEQFKKKIKLIRQSSFEFLNYNENLKKEKFEKNVFLWFGGRGAILKGLDLVLEYFSKNKDLVLHVVGPVEEQFCKVYEKELFFSSNIYFHGYLPVYSEKFLKIANEASFIILPSASEGGIPGSVINALRLGMIPIVSKYAAMDDIMEYGFLIESLSAEGIEKAVKKSLRLSKEDILNLFRKNYNFVSSNFNIKTFSSDFESVISDIIKIDSK